MRIFWLRSAVGERKQWSADGETAGTESERNAAAEPQTEARRSCGTLRMPARDERAVLWSGAGVVERHTSDRQPVKRNKTRAGHGGFRYLLRFGRHAADMFCHLKTTQRKNHQQKQNYEHKNTRMLGERRQRGRGQNHIST